MTDDLIVDLARAYDSSDPRAWTLCNAAAIEIRRLRLECARLTAWAISAQSKAHDLAIAERERDA